MRLIKAEVEVTEDEKHFRVIPMRISEISQAESIRLLKEVSSFLSGDEFVYQICAPCKGCSLSQPFYDFFNGFTLLESAFWKNHRLTMRERIAKLFP